MTTSEATPATYKLPESHDRLPVRHDPGHVAPLALALAAAGPDAAEGHGHSGTPVWLEAPAEEAVDALGACV